MRALVRAKLVLCLLVLVVAPSCAEKRSAPAPARAAAQEKALTTAAAPGQTVANPSDAPAKRLVIKEAKLQLGTTAPARLVEAAPAIAQKYGGFVVKSETRGVGGSPVEAEVVLRVSAERLDPALAELRKFGDVLSESVTGQDVTAEYVDVEARLKAKRVLEERLLALASTSTRVEDTLKVESELGRVRSEIEQAEGRSRYLQESARLSSVEVSAVSPSQPGEPGVESFGSKMTRAWSRAGNACTDVTAGRLSMVGVLLPLVFAGLLVLAPLWFWYHRRQRRRAAVNGQTGRRTQSSTMIG